MKILSNKKFELILAAGVLSLAAYGEEQSEFNDDPEVEAEEETEENCLEASAHEAISGAADLF